jgi:hypothetical protein
MHLRGIGRQLGSFTAESEKLHFSGDGNLIIQHRTAAALTRADNSRAEKTQMTDDRPSAMSAALELSCFAQTAWLTPSQNANKENENDGEENYSAPRKPFLRGLRCYLNRCGRDCPN